MAPKFHDLTISKIEELTDDAKAISFQIPAELKNDYASILSSAKKRLRKLTDKPRYLLFSHGSTIKEDHQFESYKQLNALLNKHAPNKLNWQHKHFNNN